MPQSRRSQSHYSQSSERSELEARSHALRWREAILKRQMMDVACFNWSGLKSIQPESSWKLVARLKRYQLELVARLKRYWHCHWQYCTGIGEGVKLFKFSFEPDSNSTVLVAPHPTTAAKQLLLNNWM
eukprot:232998-Rhodomonas_salina.1